MTSLAAPAPEHIVCDTNVVSLLYATASKPGLISHWSQDQRERINRAIVATTIFTLGEVRSGYVINGWGDKRIAQVEQALSRYLLLPVDFDVLDCYVDIRSLNHTQMSDNDMWIAATAMARKYPLATCDLDFCRLSDDLELLYLPRTAESPLTCP